MSFYLPADVRNGVRSPSTAATPSKALHTPRRASESSISACVRSRCASATSVMLPEPCPVPGCGLLLGRASRLQLNRRVLRDAARSFENRLRLFDPAVDVLQGLIVIGRGAALIVDFDFLLGANRKPIESGKSDARSKSPILDVRSETAGHSTCSPVRLNPCASRISGALKIETRIVDALETPFPAP